MLPTAQIASTSPDIPGDPACPVKATTVTSKLPNTDPTPTAATATSAMPGYASTDRCLSLCSWASRGLGRGCVRR